MNEENEERYIYELLEIENPRKEYGLLVKEKFPEGWTVVAVAAPFSPDQKAVAELVARCNQRQLDPSHLMEVVCEFMDEQDLATI